MPQTLPELPINFKYPLQYASEGAFACNTATIDAIADDLKVLLKTNWGERVIYYDFGANLRALIFSHTTDLKQRVTDSITSAVEKWMPYVTVENIDLVLNEQDATLNDNQARILVDFGIGQTGLTGQVTAEIR